MNKLTKILIASAVAAVLALGYQAYYNHKAHVRQLNVIVLNQHEIYKAITNKTAAPKLKPAPAPAPTAEVEGK